MNRVIKASVIQLSSGPIVEGNLKEVIRLVNEAKTAGSELVVLPENFAYMGYSCTDLTSIKENVRTGDLQRFLSDLAKHHGIWIVGGTIPTEIEGSEKIHASCFVFDDRGVVVGRYDKIHLFDVHLLDTDESYNESAVILPGDTPQVIETPFGNLGLAICYDLRFPELFRLMQEEEAQIIALPAAFTAATGEAHWEPLLRARAIENLCYVLASAQGGYHVSGRSTWGHSMIIDPWGTIMNQHATGAAAVQAILDMNLLGMTRENFPSLSHRKISCH